MGWFRRSGRLAKDTDPVASWGERVFGVVWPLVAPYLGPAGSGLVAFAVGLFVEYPLSVALVGGALVWALAQVVSTARVQRKALSTAHSDVQGVVSEQASASETPYTDSRQVQDAAKPREENEQKIEVLKDEHRERLQKREQEFQGQIERLTTERDEARAESRSASEQRKEHIRQLRSLKKSEREQQIKIQRLEEEKSQLEAARELEKNQLEAAYEQEKTRRSCDGIHHELTKLIEEGESLLSRSTYEGQKRDWDERLHGLLMRVWGAHTDTMYRHAQWYDTYGYEVSSLPDEASDQEKIMAALLNILRDRANRLKSDPASCELPPDFEIEDYRTWLNERQ